MGFDSYPLGQNARELIRMVDGGLTPMEGIVAATSNAAEAIGLADVGRVEPGAVADLIVLDGDPLSEPAVLLDTERIRLVVQGARSSRRRPVQGREPEQSRPSRCPRGRTAPDVAFPRRDELPRNSRTFLPTVVNLSSRGTSL
jgi:hypothetical protein